MTGKTSKVLIVDDEEILLRAMRRLLDKDLPNIKTLWALSGEEALHLMEEEIPQVALVDMKLVGKYTGRNTLQEIQRRWPQTVTAIFTGYMDEEELKNTITSVNCFKFFFKPFDNEMLVAIINEAISFQKKMAAREIGNDRRRAPRLSTACPVHLFISNGMIVGTVKDVSMTGLRVETHIPLALGDIVGFDLDLFDIRVKGEGAVVRSQPVEGQHSSGLHFTGFEGNSQECLKSAMYRYLYFPWA